MTTCWSGSTTHVNPGRCGGDLRRGHEGAVPRDVQRIGHQQVDIAVDSAAKLVCSRARRQTWIPVVVEPHSHQVVAGFYEVGNVEREPRVPALVAAGAPAVDDDFGILKGRVEFQEQALASPLRPRLKMFPVPAVSHVELSRPEVGQAEGVRQLDGFPRGVLEAGGSGAGVIAEGGLPVAIEDDPLAIGRGSAEGRGRKSGGCQACQQKSPPGCGEDSWEGLQLSGAHTAAGTVKTEGKHGVCEWSGGRFRKNNGQAKACPTKSALAFPDHNVERTGGQPTGDTASAVVLASACADSSAIRLRSISGSSGFVRHPFIPAPRQASRYSFAAWAVRPKIAG